MVISEQSLAGIEQDDLSSLLRTMLLIRRFEEKAAEMYARGKIKGFLHLYIGQEAVAGGVIPRLRPDDYIYSHYREHGHALARGLDSGAVMAELFGRSTGVSKGLGGSMHLFDVSKRFMGGYAIVGGQIPLACGAALACKRLGTDSAVLCIIGDGAVNEGAFHESLNLASIWKLPVLFLLENNLYGMGTQVSRVTATPHIYKHAEVYGIRARQADGMDVMEMRSATDEALASIRRGDGPFFLEAMTYRFRGHSMADPEFYRDKEEIERWRQRDPIRSFQAALLGAGRLMQEQLDEIARDVEREVDEAVRFADESPEPPLDALHSNIYAPVPDESGDTRDA